MISPIALTRTFILSILIGVTGCANVQSVDTRTYGQVYEETIPTVGATATMTLGDTLIQQSIVTRAPGIHLLAPYRTEWVRNSGDRAWPFTFEAGTTLVQTAIYQGVPIYSGASVGGMLDTSGNQLGSPYGIGVLDDGSVRYVMVLGGVIEETPGRQVAHEAVDAIAVSPDNFRQEFIYSGRDTDSLLFTYREFSGDMIRPAFTQNVTYSVSEGSVVAFKNLQLDIISAGNTEIEYRILNGF